MVNIETSIGKSNYKGDVSLTFIIRKILKIEA